MKEKCLFKCGREIFERLEGETSVRNKRFFFSPSRNLRARSAKILGHASCEERRKKVTKRGRIGEETILSFGQPLLSQRVSLGDS